MPSKRPSKHSKGARRDSRSPWGSSNLGACPTPEKRRFKTMKEARLFAEEQARLFYRRAQTPYLCSCGFVHLSSF